MKIRKATKKDLKEVTKLFLEESGKKPYNQKYTLKTANSKINDMFNFGNIYLSFIDKDLTGFIAIAGEGKKEIYIDEFWLRKKCQRKGIGSELLKFVQEKYKRKGVKSISVMTSRKAGAFKFYKKFRFKENKEDIILKKVLK
jgi:aminoglycoside 6'-N-acetyltransferase I